MIILRFLRRLARLGGGPPPPPAWQHRPVGAGPLNQKLGASGSRGTSRRPTLYIGDGTAPAGCSPPAPRARSRCPAPVVGRTRGPPLVGAMSRWRSRVEPR